MYILTYQTLKARFSLSGLILNDRIEAEFVGNPRIRNSFFGGFPIFCVELRLPCGVVEFRTSYQPNFEILLKQRPGNQVVLSHTRVSRGKYTWEQLTVNGETGLLKSKSQ